MLESRMCGCLPTITGQGYYFSFICFDDTHSSCSIAICIFYLVLLLFQIWSVRKRAARGLFPTTHSSLSLKWSRYDTAYLWFLNQMAPAFWIFLRLHRFCYAPALSIFKCTLLIFHIVSSLHRSSAWSLTGSTKRCQSTPTTFWTGWHGTRLAGLGATTQPITRTNTRCFR